MQTLPSGLPERVGNHENVSRFLTQGSHFNSHGAKPAAFLPHPNHRNTSVFRIGNEPDRLKSIWAETAAGDRSLKGVAILKAAAVRAASLDLASKEPPPAHANIEGWPWLQTDPEEQKARQKLLALQLAQASEVLIW